ncbi:MAG: CoA ester lyase [Steroidobacteraceae bacterium]
MSARSLLFVPGDSDRKLAKVAAAGADLVILDLEDAVAADQKPAARQRVREFIAAQSQQFAASLWVRINPLETPEALLDLVAVIAAGLDGIMLPKARDANDIRRLGAYLDVLEVERGMERGATRILPIATETAEAMFSLGSFASCRARLYGITWGAEDLSAALGASGNKEPDGRWTTPYQLARSFCLFAAGAARVAAFDTVFVDVRNADGLRSSCADARRDGFSGKLAIHPDQVAIINEAFLPSAAELAQARRIVALFAANPGSAALTLDGQMVDIPHLKQAEKVLARAAHSGS